MKHGILYGILFVLAVFGTLILLGQTAASRMGGESGQCWFSNECRYENHGFGRIVGYRQAVCGGSWMSYGGGWKQDVRCVYPEKEVRRYVPPRSFYEQFQQP